MEGAFCRRLLRHGGVLSQRVAASTVTSAGGSAERFLRSPLRTASQRCTSALLGGRCRSFSNQAIGEEETEWQMSTKMGKSTVTQELWRRREADSLGVGSSHSVAYRFSTSHQLRDEYVGNTGKVLIGRLLEDLDALAGNVAFDWCSDTLDSKGQPPLLVTAAVDRITFSRPLMITEDLYLSGRVIWTGSSSMLVRMTMKSGRRPGVGELLMEADFVYVARDRAASKSAKIHQLVPETPEDKELFEKGQQHAALQKQRRGKLKINEAKDPAAVMAMVNEGDTLVELPQVRRNSRKALMANTSQENTVLTKPQDQNTAGNVFGGCLMRCCYELAFSTCFAFAGRHPTFKEIMEFVFDKPVPRGSILRLRSRVVYTSGSDAVIEVDCIVIQPDLKKTFRANKILVVFDCNLDAAEMEDVVPHSISEALAKLSAKEQYEESFGAATKA